MDSGSFSGLIAKISGSIQRGLIAHHTLDKLGKWSPCRLTAQGLVYVTISIFGQAYDELGLKDLGEGGVTPAQANPDTGAQMCMDESGLVRWELGRLWSSLP